MDASKLARHPRRIVPKPIVQPNKFARGIEKIRNANLFGCTNRFVGLHEIKMYRFLHTRSTIRPGCIVFLTPEAQFDWNVPFSYSRSTSSDRATEQIRSASFFNSTRKFVWLHDWFPDSSAGTRTGGFTSVYAFLLAFISSAHFFPLQGPPLYITDFLCSPDWRDEVY